MGKDAPATAAAKEQPAVTNDAAVTTDASPAAKCRLSDEAACAMSSKPEKAAIAAPTDSTNQSSAGLSPELAKTVQLYRDAVTSQSGLRGMQSDYEKVQQKNLDPDQAIRTNRFHDANGGYVKVETIQPTMKRQEEQVTAQFKALAESTDKVPLNSANSPQAALDKFDNAGRLAKLAELKAVYPNQQLNTLEDVEKLRNDVSLKLQIQKSDGKPADQKLTDSLKKIEELSEIQGTYEGLRYARIAPALKLSELSKTQDSTDAFRTLAQSMIVDQKLELRYITNDKGVQVIDPAFDARLQRLSQDVIAAGPKNDDGSPKLAPMINNFAMAAKIEGLPKQAAEQQFDKFLSSAAGGAKTRDALMKELGVDKKTFDEMEPADRLYRKAMMEIKQGKGMLSFVDEIKNNPPEMAKQLKAATDASLTVMQAAADYYSTHGQNEKALDLLVEVRQHQRMRDSSKDPAILNSPVERNEQATFGLLLDRVVKDSQHTAELLSEKGFAAEAMKIVEKLGSGAADVVGPEKYLALLEKTGSRGTGTGPLDVDPNVQKQKFEDGVKGLDATKWGEVVALLPAWRESLKGVEPDVAAKRLESLAQDLAEKQAAITKLAAVSSPTIQQQFEMEKLMQGKSVEDLEMFSMQKRLYKAAVAVSPDIEKDAKFGTVIADEKGQVQDVSQFTQKNILPNLEKIITEPDKVREIFAQYEKERVTLTELQALGKNLTPEQAKQKAVLEKGQEDRRADEIKLLTMAQGQGQFTNLKVLETLHNGTNVLNLGAYTEKVFLPAIAEAKIKVGGAEADILTANKKYKEAHDLLKTVSERYPDLTGKNSEGQDRAPLFRDKLENALANNDFSSAVDAYQKSSYDEARIQFAQFMQEHKNDERVPTAQELMDQSYDTFGGWARRNKHMIAGVAGLGVGLTVAGACVVASPFTAGGSLAGLPAAGKLMIVGGAVLLTSAATDFAVNSALGDSRPLSTRVWSSTKNGANTAALAVPMMAAWRAPALLAEVTLGTANPVYQALDVVKLAKPVRFMSPGLVTSSYSQVLNFSDAAMTNTKMGYTEAALMGVANLAMPGPTKNIWKTTGFIGVATVGLGVGIPKAQEWLRKEDTPLDRFMKSGTYRKEHPDQ